MKTYLTKSESLCILQYYNIQVPNDDNKIIQSANKYIERNLCKCIKNKKIKFSSRQNKKTKKQKNKKI